MTRILATTLALVPGLALAHGGPEGHAHPHGFEGVALALVAIGLGVALWRAFR